MRVEQGKIIHAENRFRQRSEEGKADIFRLGSLTEFTEEDIKVFKEDPERFDPLRQRILAQLIKEHNL